MKIQETPWEKRNLGVTSVNFVIEKKDKCEDIDETILYNEDYEYQTVKLPVNKMDIHNKLNAAGFLFIEGKFELVCNLKEIVLPEELGDIFKEIQYYRVDNCEDIDFILNKISEGVFDTDKIAIDPYFGLDKSAHRYRCWTEDELEKGNAFAYHVTYNDDIIGFFILKRINDKVVDSMLAGLYDREKYSGLGLALMYYHMLEAKKLGFKKIVTEVSTNNMDSLKSHLPFGYKIKDMYYVMCKHI